jgi:membrane protein implicated in regulation of membrane protease activity
VTSAHRTRLIAAIVGLPLGVLWVWLGVKVVGPPWLHLWGWGTLAFILAAAAFAGHRSNMKRASEPGYLLQDTNAIVVRALRPEGQVRVGSELWSARSRNAEPLEVGTPVQVYGREGLVLLVKAQR